MPPGIVDEVDLVDQVEIDDEPISPAPGIADQADPEEPALESETDRDDSIDAEPNSSPDVPTSADLTPEETNSD